jgi:hypothetical protein
LATKAHFSSNCASRVWGGKSDEFVVELAGVAPGEEAEAYDGVLVDLDQAAGLADATALGEVLQDGKGLVFGESAIKQGSPLAFREACFTGATAEQEALVGAVAQGHREVAVAAFAVVGAVRVEAAEARKVIHDRPSLVQAKRHPREQPARGFVGETLPG